MRFTVLGRLRVDSEAGQIPIPAAKQRVLLAALITRVNRAVPVDTLIEVLWAGEPPASARKALRWHVMKLREALGDKELLVWETDGYALRTDPGNVDCKRFEELARDANPYVDSQPVLAGRWLGEALALWHGTAFEEFDDVTELSEESRRLDELRLTVLAQWYAVELRLGRH
ncbi:MAG: AfsR/SARP family transcriptional regulator, partial [Stackebrandtia sp.]